jgi:hypothetical protein
VVLVVCGSDHWLFFLCTLLVFEGLLWILDCSLIFFSTYDPDFFHYSFFFCFWAYGRA